MARPKNPNPCASLNCDQPIYAKGRCRGHYLALKAGRDPDAPLRIRRSSPGGFAQFPPLRVTAEVYALWAEEADRRGLSLYEFLRRAIEITNPRRLTVS